MEANALQGQGGVKDKVVDTGRLMQFTEAAHAEVLADQAQRAVRGGLRWRIMGALGAVALVAGGVIAARGENKDKGADTSGNIPVPVASPEPESLKQIPDKSVPAAIVEPERSEEDQAVQPETDGTGPDPEVVVKTVRFRYVTTDGVEALISVANDSGTVNARVEIGGRVYEFVIPQSLEARFGGSDEASARLAACVYDDPEVHEYMADDLAIRLRGFGIGVQNGRLVFAPQ